MILAFIAGATVFAFGILVGVSMTHTTVDKIFNKRND